MVSALDQLYQQVIMDHAAEKHGQLSSNAFRYLVLSS